MYNFFSKISNYPFLILFIILGTVSCTQNSSTENKDSISVDKAASSTNTIGNEVDRTGLSNEILVAENGFERMAAIGKSFDEVINNEATPATDSASNYKAFSKYFNNSEEEFVDIQYFHNGANVTSVNFDVYLNNAQDVKNLFLEFSQQFSKKYGKGKMLQNEIIWQLPSNQTLKLKDVSLKLAAGLQINLSKKDQTNQ